MGDAESLILALQYNNFPFAVARELLDLPVIHAAAVVFSTT